MLAGLAVWAEINRREAVAQPEVAERNFEVAKQGANSLVFDIAQALRHQEGMRTETVRTILGSAEQVIDKLVAKSGDNLDLLRLQAALLDEFAQTYDARATQPRRKKRRGKRWPLPNVWPKPIQAMPGGSVTLQETGRSAPGAWRSRRGAEGL